VSDTVARLVKQFAKNGGGVVKPNAGQPAGQA
jgi:hypothetical protein